MLYSREMKSVFLCLILAIFIPVASAEGLQNIVLKSRFDLESSEAFISQLRIFLTNNKFGDPYSLELKKPLSVDLVQVIEEMPEDTQKWIHELQSLLQVKLFESSYKLVVHKLGYSLKDFNSEFRAGNSKSERIEYVTVNYVQGLKLKADKISFEVELKHTQTREPIKFSIELIGPVFLINQDFLTELTMGWSTVIHPEAIHLNLEKVNLEKIMQGVAMSPHLIEFSVKDLVMPKVSVRIGSKEVKFSEEKIEDFFRSRHEELKKGILDILSARMGNRFENVIKDYPQQLLIPRRYALTSDINGVLDIQKMTVNNSGIVQFDLDGHYCEDGQSLKADFCKDRKIVAKPRRMIPTRDFDKSLREMNRSLVERKRNIALSVSEDYLNQIIEATIHAGLWEDKLEGKDFVLGPEKSFVLADEKGELFSLYLDIKYKLKGPQKLLVGRSELRFPIKFMIALKIIDIDGMPHFTIKVKKVATDQKLLLEGLKKYDLPTTVNSVPRFRKKVLKTIMEDVGSFENETLVSIEMPELKGTYLDQLEFFSDGLGRGTAILGFK